MWKNVIYEALKRERDIELYNSMGVASESLPPTAYAIASKCSEAKQSSAQRVGRIGKILQGGSRQLNNRRPGGRRSRRDNAFRPQSHR